MMDQEIESLAKKMAEVEVKTKATTESAQKKEKHRKALNAAGYVAGSIALFVVACATLPSILSNISGALYKSSLKKANRNDDDWGPVVERKEKPDESEQPEPIAIQEEGADGD